MDSGHLIAPLVAPQPTHCPCPEVYVYTSIIHIFNGKHGLRRPENEACPEQCAEW